MDGVTAREEKVHDETGEYVVMGTSLYPQVMTAYETEMEVLNEDEKIQSITQMGRHG